MAIYALGDIQGCYDDLMRLLERIQFDPAQDTLWFAGDLVNRGPDSLSTLRFVKQLGNRAITVLGNHDLHLLAIAEGIKQNKDVSLQTILNASDRDELLDWLRQQPVLHHDKQLAITLVHAGLPPQWDIEMALQAAHELESVLRSDQYHVFLQDMYGDEPDLWSEDLHGQARLRYICNCFTRLRFVDSEGRYEMQAKGSPEHPPAGLRPWYSVPERKTKSDTLLFGHWSTLGAYHQENVYALDTGCVWGGHLSALRLDLDTPQYLDVKCPGHQTPGL